MQIGCEVDDVLRIEPLHFFDQQRAQAQGAAFERRVGAEVRRHFGQDGGVVLDRRAAIGVAVRVESIESLLRFDDRQALLAHLFIERLVGAEVGVVVGQDERVVGDGLLRVNLGRVFRGGAAAERGHDEQHQGEQRGHEDRAAEVLQGGAPARGEQSATAVRGIVGCAGVVAEMSPLQCAMGHGTPSLVFLRSGGVHNIPLVLIWWPRLKRRGDELSGKYTSDESCFQSQRIIASADQPPSQPEPRRRRRWR